MSILDRLASSLKVKSDVPNQELARDLVREKNSKGIKEIVINLRNRDKNIQSDCIKALYEIGYLKSELISDYHEEFIRLLNSKNNRLVWGSMYALSCIAHLKPGEIYRHVELIKELLKAGSVITVDNAVKTLAVIASAGDEYNRKIFLVLLGHLTHCRPKEIPQHSEKILVAVNQDNKGRFIEILNQRLSLLTPSQASRVRKVIKEAGER